MFVLISFYLMSVLVNKHLDDPTTIPIPLPYHHILGAYLVDLLAV